MLIANLGGRTVAFNIAVFGWILCGVFNLLLYFTVLGDEAAVEVVLQSLCTVLSLKTLVDQTVRLGLPVSKTMPILFSAPSEGRMSVSL